MKFNMLCAATLSVVVAGGALASFTYDIQTPVGLLVNESLDGFGYSRRNPVKGEIWELTSPSMKVLQVVDGGALVERSASSTPEAKPFFVKTMRVYADGDTLVTGYYRADGTVSYNTVLGAQRTVYAFSELSPDQQREVSAFKQDKAAVDAAQRQAAAERQQRAEKTVEFKKSKERIAAEEAAEKERIERERVERENAHTLARLNAEKDSRIASMKAAAKAEAYKQKAEHEREMARLNAEKDNRIAAMNAEAEAEANLQKAEHAREMARLAKEREEQDKENRKKIAAAKAEKRKADAKLAVEVQKERVRYAADVFSTLDFNFKHHLVVQRSIRKNLRVKIIDPEWEKLANYHAKQDWLGLINAIDGEEYDEFPSEKEIDVILDSLKKKSFCVSIKGLQPPQVVNVYARRMSGNSSVYGGENGWGHMAVFCEDADMAQIKTIDDVKGEEVKVAPFDGKILVIDSDYRVHQRLNQEVRAKSEQRLDLTLYEKAEEVEEWLKLN